MERKRAYLEIARDILKAAQYGAKPTELVYKSNLNFNVIKRYLREMEGAGLILVDDLHGPGNRTRLYHTTEKGKAFIEAVGRTLEIYYSPTTIDGALPEIMHKPQTAQGTWGPP